jgi:PKD repeat protein
MKRLLAFAVGAVLCGVVGCERTATGPRPFEVTVTPSAQSAAVGDSVEFKTNAQGGYLIQAVADYGDGTVESHDFAEAQTLQVHFKHAYSASGTYTIVVTVTDAVAGTKSVTIADFPVS